MSWKQTTITLMSEIFAMAIRTCLFVDGILAALASVWFCCKFLYFSMMWLNRVLFDTAW